MAMVKHMARVTILVPTLNEERALPATLRNISALMPAPDEVLIVDGGSSDKTAEIARASGFTCVTSPRTGRGAQINYGVEQAKGDIVCVLHADSLLPIDAVAEIRAAMADPNIALASFTPRIAGPSGTRWGSTVHNWIKTWYAPLLMRPWLFIRGVRLLFGDHAMFFRREHYLAVGGCDERVVVMEEADLCIKLNRFGRTRMIPRWVWTSDRRITEWGRWRANYIYLKVGIMWALGARERLADHYPDVR
ncbi:glycosyltransferase [Sphingorhabdus arenilitoris]|uniref:Glycosyltransferase n=1 Tax=Sphingorhabdus arenilitoris TaxID=1490041 RepID=A0ABV8RC66_9SPHN